MVYRLMWISLTILFSQIVPAQTLSARWSDIQKQVLAHYQKGDSLKLKAAQFLLDNISAHGSFSCKGIDYYYE